MFATLLTKPQHWIRTTPRESWRIFVLCLESRRVRRLRRLQELIIQAFCVWWWHRHRCRLCPGSVGGSSGSFGSNSAVPCSSTVRGAPCIDRPAIQSANLSAS